MAKSRRHDGTGAWLINSQVFKEWRCGSRRHLWLYGLAGSGKTVLSATILDDLWKTGERMSLAYFFDFNDPMKQNLEGLLRSLAIQLWSLGGKATKQLDELFISCNQGQVQPGESVLSTCVKSMMDMTGSVVVVIDALDECTTRSSLLRWIKSLASSSIQFIVTSRPELDFISDLPRYFHKSNCILLDQKAIDADIQSYVVMTLKQDPRFTSKRLPRNLRDEICEKVGNGADGM
jgi:hypothetical protein